MYHLRSIRRMTFKMAKVYLSPPLQTQTEVLQRYKRHVSISNLTAGYLYAFLEPSSS